MPQLTEKDQGKHHLQPKLNTTKFQLCLAAHTMVKTMFARGVFP